MAQTCTAYLEYPVAKLTVPSNINYDKILDRHGGGGGIPDPAHLQTMTEDLKTLTQLAQARCQILDDGMREMAKRKKEFERDEKERLEQEQALRESEAKAEEQARFKREAEEEENVRVRAGAQLKKKNERNNVQEDRPLTLGAHGLARQDGQVDMPSKGEPEVYYIFVDLTPWAGYAPPQVSLGIGTAGPNNHSPFVFGPLSKRRWLTQSL